VADPLGDLARTHYCGALSAADVGRAVTLMGWAATRRDLGGVIFIDLRDREGLCQVVARPEVSREAHAAADRVRSEYVLAVVGEVVARSADTVNPKIPTGDVEVLAREIRVLSEAKTPPLPIEEETSASEELRLKYRFLDLRRPRMQKNLRLRHRVTLEVRRYLDEKGFLEIETPFLTKSTPEGARDYLVPSRVHPGHFYALPQSPQLFKQILMISGVDKYFQIARCFRDEDLRADRQPEFTQIDIEMSFARQEMVFDLVEPMYQRVCRLAGIEIPRPFPRLAYAEAMERYGTDKPDLRFQMPIADVTEEMRGLGLETFPGLIAEGARARALALPAGGVSGTRMRKINEELWLGRIVNDARASKRGLFTLRATDEAIGNLGKKGASEAVARRLLERAGAGRDDTVVVAVDAPGPVAMAMGILRLEMGRELKLIDEGAYRFLWVTDFPLFERDPATGRLSSAHHPFTAPLADDVPLLDTEPAAVRAQAYDVVLNGVELASGSIRIHDSGLQRRIFRVLQLSEEETRERFGFFLEALQYGTPPHGGIAPGLDRLVMILAGESSLREVIAFPKTASATDLMTAAPSVVPEAQLRELGILVVKRPAR
jgi:aspartyl-tRNA synthetase